MLDLVSLESKAVEKGCIEQTGSPRTKFTKFYKLHIIHHYSSLFIIIHHYPGISHEHLQNLWRRRQRNVSEGEHGVTWEASPNKPTWPKDEKEWRQANIAQGSGHNYHSFHDPHSWETAKTRTDNEVSTHINSCVNAFQYVSVTGTYIIDASRGAGSPRIPTVLSVLFFLCWLKGSGAISSTVVLQLIFSQSPMAVPHLGLCGGNHCFRAGHALQKPSDIQERYDLMPTGHLSLGEILKIPTIRLSSWLAASCSRVTDPQGSKVRAIWAW